MILKETFHAALLLAAFSTAAWAAEITGTVRNATTGKPAAGDDVVLLNMASGMDEVGRAKTDSQGRFRLTVDDAATPHLIRVNHQKVNYHKTAPPGTQSVEVEVYDAAAKVEGVRAIVEVLRFEADSSSLQVTELYGISNNSQPPRTQMSQRSFEIFLPAGAEIQASTAMSTGGMPVNSAPVPTGEKNRYAFVFPLRPGETRFQVSYRLPYSGEADFQPRLAMPTEHMVVMVPPSMRFRSNAGEGAFQAMPEETGANVQVATSARPGAEPGFHLSGVGVMPREAQAQGTGETKPLAQGAAPAGGGGGGEEAAGRPGGGLGRPIDTPDPLHEYRWQFLGGLTLLLAMGAFFVWNRSAGAAAAAPAAGFSATPGAGFPPVARDRSALLLEALKDELFQLETERHQGKISAAEYEQAKAALDQTIQRAVTRRKRDS
ncbi:MAG TPA: carboxypeptidase regulatory-like domain-containing protein [Terriglobales bacterium]|nr:carboxypeptidase regulatory-like domain-containing protein [Terriglobales bacterium]